MSAKSFQIPKCAEKENARFCHGSLKCTRSSRIVAMKSRREMLSRVVYVAYSFLVTRSRSRVHQELAGQAVDWVRQVIIHVWKTRKGLLGVIG